MATHTNLSSLFTDIADSIRSVSGGTASIQADTFPTAIQSLGSGFAKNSDGKLCRNWHIWCIKSVQFNVRKISNIYEHSVNSIFIDLVIYSFNYFKEVY